MKSAKYNPFLPFKPGQVDNLIEDFAGRSLSELFGTEWVSTTPAINIVETESSYAIQLAAPGLQKEDFEVSIDDDNLIITVSKANSETPSEGKVTRREFNYSSFKRSFYLSDDINRDHIDAKYELGVLTVEMAKKVDVTPPVRTISIL